jgi:hypothetical protein
MEKAGKPSTCFFVVFMLYFSFLKEKRGSADKLAIIT